MLWIYYPLLIAPWLKKFLLKNYAYRAASFYYIDLSYIKLNPLKVIKHIHTQAISYVRYSAPKNVIFHHTEKIIGRLVLGQGSLCYIFHATAAAATVFPI